MKNLKERMTEKGMDYVLVGDYYIPALQLPEENRSIGICGGGCTKPIWSCTIQPGTMTWSCPVNFGHTLLA